MIHGIIDGFCRTVCAKKCHNSPITNIYGRHQITGLQASDNNRSATVLDLFESAMVEYGTPSRVRDDCGSENIDVATYMIMKNGSNRASFMWGS